MILFKSHRLVSAKEVVRFCHSASSSLSSIPTKKIKVPCPWGHISGIWWGRCDIQPIVAVHGWLDNCGSWKRLAENIVDDDTSILALDLPGTGLSSHLPQFYNYNFSGSAAILRRVQKHFDFKDLIIFGHSGGSASSFLFTALYPEIVKAYLGVDYVFYSYKRQDRRADATGEILDEFIELALKQSSPKTYSWEDAKGAWINGSLLGATNPELVEDLMEHGMNKVDNKFSFSRDIRLRHLKAVSVDCFSVDQAEALAHSITSHVCLIKANDSPFFDLGIRNSASILDILKNKAKSFHFHNLDGHHHIHMEHAPEVAKIAKSFLNKIC